MMNNDTNKVILYSPRLPFHSEIGRRFGIDKNAWKVLAEAIFPLAKTSDSICLALSYCRARKLDPFKRPVHIVPMWSSVENAMVDTIWPGISELRTTAFRTSNYAGQDKAEFGDFAEVTFSDTSSKGKTKGQSRTVTVLFPEWCQITVYRFLPGAGRCAFVGPKIWWTEAYGKWADTSVPNDMWARRPVGQLEKVAEAAALRRAFPEEAGNELTAEEMEGQRFDSYHGPETTHSLAERLASATPSENGFARGQVTGQISDKGIADIEAAAKNEELFAAADEAADAGPEALAKLLHSLTDAEFASLEPYIPALRERALAANGSRKPSGPNDERLIDPDELIIDPLSDQEPENEQPSEAHLLEALKAILKTVETVEELGVISKQIGSQWYKTATQETKQKVAELFKARKAELQTEPPSSEPEPYEPQCKDKVLFKCAEHIARSNGRREFDAWYSRLKPNELDMLPVGSADMKYLVSLMKR